MRRERKRICETDCKARVCFYFVFCPTGKAIDSALIQDVQRRHKIIYTPPHQHHHHRKNPLAVSFIETWPKIKSERHFHFLFLFLYYYFFCKLQRDLKRFTCIPLNDLTYGKTGREIKLSSSGRKRWETVISQGKLFVSKYNLIF